MITFFVLNHPLGSSPGGVEFSFLPAEADSNKALRKFITRELSSFRAFDKNGSN
jgi:hypothetical protein